MKKTLLLFAIALCSFYGFSQDAVYGVRVGFNISNLDFEPAVPGSVENTHRNGLALGFLAEYRLTKCFSIAPELQFSAEGAKDDNVEIYGKETSLRLDYIQLPILFKYKITDQLSIGLGPQVNLKSHDHQDTFKNLTFSGIGGLEYMITDEFFLDFRYSYGISNIFDDEVIIQAKNINMQFGFGIKL